MALTTIKCGQRIKSIKEIINIFLNFIVAFALLWSAQIYTSLYSWVPWYEPDGLQFLGIIFFSLPTLMIFCFAFFLLKKNKKALFILFTVLSFVLPLIIDQSLDGIIFYVGQIFCVLSAFISILIIVYEGYFAIKIKRSLD